VPRATETRVLDVSRLGEGRAGGLAYDPARPLRRGRLGLHDFLEFEEEPRILIARQEPEKEPLGELERPRPWRPGKLQEPPVLRDRADFLDAVLGGGRKAEEVPAPDAGLLLALDDGERRLRLGDGILRGLNGRGIRAGRGKLDERAVPDRLAGIGQKPAQRDPVLRRKFQRGLPGDMVGSKRRIISPHW
jgi:hypothetical protein